MATNPVRKRIEYEDITIASAASLSAEVDTRGRALAGIIMPAAWTTATPPGVDDHVIQLGNDTFYVQPMHHVTAAQINHVQPAASQRVPRLEVVVQCQSCKRLVLPRPGEPHDGKVPHQRQPTQIARTKRDPLKLARACVDVAQIAGP